jgi:outer membrane protein OmpA-like peptidoglycan-associated protein
MKRDPQARTRSDGTGITDRRAGRSRRPPAAPDLLTAPVPEVYRYGAVEALGHHAGNRAVQHALAGNRPVQRALAGTGRRAVQRWGADEHRRLGDTTGLLIDIGDGVQLTFGQIVALAGDEFGSEADLRAAIATPAGRAMIRAHLEHAGLPGPAMGTLPAPSAAQVKAAESEYVTLALTNSTHFVGGGTAVEEWTSHHARAVDTALQAGLSGDPELLNSARLTEAFGAHFLTDAFSSGHIRVPRQEIIDHYVGVIAPAVFDHLVDHVREHLVDEIYDQVEQQTAANEAAWLLGPIGGLGVRAHMRRKIRNAISPKIATGIADAGGRAEAIRKLGLGLAGLISGAMHDAENRDGLQVISTVHPDPWTAFGDGRLDDNPKHRAQVEAALHASVADLDVAHRIGVEEHQQVFNLPAPSALPSAVYFEFGQATATPETAAAAEMVAHHLRYHPASIVALAGHTDPVGSDADNDALGADRAATVAALLTAHGVDASRITTESHGERLLVTRSPRRYARNRRVTFVFSTDAARAGGGQGPDDVAHARAQQALLAAVGPPYATEEHFPRAAPGLNAALPEWRWGSISGSLRSEMNKWVAGYVGSYRAGILASPALDPQTVDGYTVQPRPIVEALLRRVEGDAVGFLEDALGRSAD